MQLVNAITAEKTAATKGLMYIRAIVNGKEISAMVDTGATHNFVTDRMVGQLGLQVKEHPSRIKAVNSKA